MLLNCGVGEDSREALGLQGGQTSQFWKNQSWTFTGRTDAEAETPILWPPDAKSWLIRKDPDAGKDWRRREGDDRVWDSWKSSPAQWMWVWASSERWWRTGKPDLLQPMGFQRVQHDWVTEKQRQSDICGSNSHYLYSSAEGTNAIMMMMMIIKWSRDYSKQWKKNFHFMGTVHLL